MPTDQTPRPPPEHSDRELHGVVERITYANPDNGYTVLRLQPRRGRGLATVVGNLPPLNVGEQVLLRGRWTTHPKHGKQFEARSCRTREPATVEGIRKYLGSGLIKGIGPVMADRIVREFGTDTLRILEADIDQLRRVPGLGPVRIGAIGRGWEAQKAIKDIMIFLASHQVSTALAVKIYKAYGDVAIDVVKADPYRLARDIHGVGFVTADRIARGLGLPPASIERVMAGLLHLLDEATGDGHVYLPRPELVDRAVELLGVDAESVEAAVDRAFSEDIVQLQTIGDVEGVYQARLYYAELGLTHRLRDIQRGPVDRLEDLKQIDFDRALAYLRDRYAINLADRQYEAVRGALTQKVTVLTGGPGTGKTTTVRAIVRLLEARGKSFVLGAPTGRAAKRLAETTGVPAQTIHRLIGLRIGEGAQFHADNPLDVDLVILDEVSMMDTVLANAVLKAVPHDAHLLLVGDADQLPSVGPGLVLRDIIDSGAIPVVRLDVIFRQATESGIVLNAHRIKNGELPRFGRGVQDCFFLEADDPAACAEAVVDLVARRLPGHYQHDPIRDIQVIAPMHGGQVGVGALNERLQERLNPAGPGKAERAFGSRVFREGDKVIAIRNNYDLQVFNGDGGVIERIDPEDQRVDVIVDDGRLVSFDFADLDELIHAYAVTVHKAQGSEYPCVVLPIHTQHYVLLQRNLIYTALTRARDLVVVAGSRKAVAMAVRNQKQAARYTGLRDRLAGTLPLVPKGRQRELPEAVLEFLKTM